MAKVKDIILTNSVKTDAFNFLENVNIYHFPMINIKTKKIKPFNLFDFDYYIFTSQNSVDSFFDYPFVGVQYEKKINAISCGEKTEQKLRQLGVTVSFSSSSSYSADLVADLKKQSFIKGSKLAFISGNLSDFSIFESLKSFTEITRIEIYETVKNTYYDKSLDQVLKKGNSISVFASPSSFDAFISLYGSFKTDIYSIGNTTSSYIKSKGFDVITAKEQTFEGVAKEILNNYYS